MKVKLNIAVGIKGESHSKGAVVDVPKEMAAALILSKRGVAVKEAAKKKK
jgi:hypothetical protein